jgi:hypothetical protein
LVIPAAVILPAPHAEPALGDWTDAHIPMQSEGSPHPDMNNHDLCLRLWKQFIIDLMVKAPHPARRVGWTPFFKHLGQLQQSGEALFMCTDWDQIFNMCKFVLHNRTRVEGSLFPDWDWTSAVKQQNYLQMEYYNEWMRWWQGFKDTGNRVGFKQLRKVFLTKLRALAWMPAAGPQRLWETRTQVSGLEYPLLEPQQKDFPRPCIVVGQPAHAT